MQIEATDINAYTSLLTVCDEPEQPAPKPPVPLEYRLEQLRLWIRRRRLASQQVGRTLGLYHRMTSGPRRFPARAGGSEIATTEHANHAGLT